MHRLARWSLSIVAVLIALPAHAALLTFYRELGPEAPGATGSGWARATFDTDALTMRVEAEFSGLSGLTTVAHIHCCTAVPESGTVGVATYPGTFPGWPAGVSAGSYDGSFDMSLATSYTSGFIDNFGGGTVAGAFAALLAGLDGGRGYFNVHSSTFPAGEIRGFLRTVPVPEPGALVLLGLGLLAVAITLRNRRRG